MEGVEVHSHHKRRLDSFLSFSAFVSAIAQGASNLQRPKVEAQSTVRCVRFLISKLHFEKWPALMSAKLRMIRMPIQSTKAPFASAMVLDFPPSVTPTFGKVASKAPSTEASSAMVADEAKLP